MATPEYPTSISLFVASPGWCIAPTMHPQLYRASRSGNVSCLRNVAATDQRLLYSEAPQQQNALHIWARLGHVDFVQEMLGLCRHLVMQPNSDGNTPLHCAAINGRVEVVQLLSESSVSREDASLLRMRNNQGNTALHEAVLKGHDDVAIRLVQADQTLSSIVNNAGMSPLHLAGKRERSRVVHEILTNLVLGENERREVTRKCDSIGRTALHYAAERDNSEILNILLEKDLAAAYYHDNAGYSPLHITAATGCWAAFSALLEKCPDAMEQHDLNGRNVFHISVMNYKWSKDWPKQHQDMVNDTDKDGNTPPHLAAKLLSTRLVFQLLEYEGIDLNVKNKEDLTAFDVAESQVKGHSAQRETVMTILRMNGVGSGKPRKINLSEDIHPREVESRARRELTIAFSTASILVATIAFAAVFTMPGGFKSDGTPVLLKHPAFAAFLIFNTLAMCFATIGGICFAVETFVRIYGRVWNVDLWGFFFSALAYKTMLITFMTTVYVVVAPGCRWLAIVVCLICSTPILFHYLLFAYQIFNYRPPVYTVVTSPLFNFFGKIVTKKLSS